MATYQGTHARILRLFQSKGRRIEFTSSERGTYTPSTGTFATATAQSVLGWAVEDEPDLDVYASYGLIEADNRILIFRPDVYGDIPMLGWTCPWGGFTFTVRGILPFAPVGDALISTVIVTRSVQ